MNTPENLPPVATRRGLNGYFVDFRLLPELLHRTQRLRGKDAIQRNWADFLIHNDHDEHYQALEVQSPSVARTTVHAWRLATVTDLLDQDGIEIIPLLQRGASILTRTNHVWARCCPGLLLVEMEAIVYWACVASPRCLKLLDELILLRDVAMHQHREPPDSRVRNTVNAQIHEEEVTNLYLTHRDLGEDTPMPYGGTLSMIRLLDFTGLLHTRHRGYLVYLIPPV